MMRKENMSHNVRHTVPNERDVVYEADMNSAENYSPLARVVWAVFGIVNALLALRFLLRLFGANPTASFTDFVYSITSPLVGPFANVIRSTSIETGVIEWFTLLAMAIYWLIAYAIVKLFVASRPMARY